MRMEVKGNASGLRWHDLLASNTSPESEGAMRSEGSPAVVVGAYGCRLYKGGVATPADGDWYLRSALLAGEQHGGGFHQVCARASTTGR